MTADRTGWLRLLSAIRVRKIGAPVHARYGGQLHSAQSFKLTTWTTTYMQMIHRLTCPWLPQIQIAP
ncbi:hypothetical protein LSAT2_007325 [Lamellibrachia satsuma]|nr:hypothetical protein LSAT2_007325 [Lamellibrachia satsuma]